MIKNFVLIVAFFFLKISIKYQYKNSKQIRLNRTDINISVVDGTIIFSSEPFHGFFL